MSEFYRGQEFFQKKEVDLANPRYKLLLMDFHGTIADRQLWSLKGITETWKSSFGFPAPKESYKNGLHRGGLTYKQFLTQLIDDDTRISEEQKIEHRGEIGKKFDTLMKNIYIPMPGMRRVMRTILDAGINMAILTNGAQTEDISNTITDWKFPELQDHIYNGPVMNCRKPDPRSVEYVINRFAADGLEYHPEEILVVGDQFDDTNVASNAGVDCALIIRPVVEKNIALTNPYPTYVIDEPAGLLDIVAGHVEPLSQEITEVTVRPSLFK